MDFLYSLYDALVSINVPSDKARAVVDAMERDMGTTLATKQDLLLLATREDLLATKRDLLLLASKEDHLLLKQEVALLRQDITGVRTEVRQEMAGLRSEHQRDGQLLRQEMSGIRTELRQEIENRFALLTHEIGSQTLKMTVRLGSMLFLGLGLTIAALRLWN